MPSTSIPLPPSSSSAPGIVSATSTSIQSTGTSVSSVITTLSSDLPSTSNTVPILSPSIYGGSIVTTVFGGSTRTFASNGVPTTVVTGGLTTTFTSGGTTTFVTVTAIATATPGAIAEAEIGLCPAYNGKVYQGSGDALLVGCGVIYSGTIISSNTRRAINRRATANDCSVQCMEIADCVAMSFTRNACTLYSMVEGQRTAFLPAFSAVRLVLEASDAGNSSSAQFSGIVTGTSANTNAQITGITQPIITTTQMTTVISVSTSTVVLQIPPSPFTQVIPASTVTVVSSAPGQTTTAVYTSVQPPSTTTVILSTTQLVTYTTTGPISTLISTVVSTLSPAPSTQIITTTRDQSTLFYTTTIVSVLPASTLVSTHLATTTQQGTTAVSTERITLTASASTITNTTTLPVSVFSTVVSTVPAETVVSLQTVTSTISASTLTIESISTVLLTSTAPGQVTTAVYTSLVTESITTTLPASTTTFVVSVTETLHTTAVSTSISIPEASIITTTTQLASTITTTQISTPPSITLTQPTTIYSIVVTSFPVTYTTSYVETSISVSTAPGSTITTTATSLVYSTLVSTQEVTQTTSRVETRTEITTQPTTIVSTQYLPGPSPIPACLSRNNGQTYTASDGSQYMIMCGQSNAGYDLYGVTVSANGYSSCIEKCSAQGTTCNGVTWQPSSSLCTLKKRMVPVSPLQLGSSSDTDSALRLTGPLAASSRSQLVSNGGFDTGDFSSWTLDYYPGVSADVVNNAAVMGMNSGQYAYGFLNQNFGAMAGNNYLISFSPPSVVYSSGTLRSDITQFNMLAECPLGPGWTITLDDIAFYSYPPSPGYDPAPIVSVVLIAGASYSYVNFAFQQYTIPTIQEAQTFTLSADAQVSIAGRTTCTLEIGFEYGFFFGDCIYPAPGRFFCQALSTSQAFLINVRSEPIYDSTSLTVALHCSGSTGSTVALNNLYLTVNT
ncbi:hypothetical protein HII31_06648 [Pseudocercospora fuligena]|uniref:Apple domain-containing protein n=1 Tax=Pseudocercospora fuligena TaxID=685502 RepID=A0A8H6RJ14_9PEZI|nr:hypothetical protein HII31_06648 [Pseudocercospora fuligena]